MKKISKKWFVVIGIIIFILIYKVISIIPLAIDTPRELKPGISKDGTYEVVGKMNIPRSYHQSSLLNDGRVLITGGYDGSYCKSKEKCSGTNSTEIYNPKTKTFTMGPNMSLPHLYHKQFTLNSGKVVIVDINGIEIYDPETNIFKLFPETIRQRMPGPNFINYALLPNDTILVTGGAVARPKSGIPWPVSWAEIIDIKNKKVIKLPDMNVARMNHSTILMNNKIYIIGGYSHTNNCNIVEEFDPKAKIFKIVGDIKFCLSNPYLKAINKDDFLILYGQSGNLGNNYIQTYSTKVNKLVESIPVDYNNSSSNILLSDFYQKQQLINDELFIVDYEILDKTMSYFTIAEKNKNYKYSLKTNTLTPLKTKYRIPLFANLINLPDNQILVTGGMNEKEMYKEVQLHKFLSTGLEDFMPSCYYYFCPYPRFISDTAFIIERSK